MVSKLEKRAQRGEWPVRPGWEAHGRNIDLKLGIADSMKDGSLPGGWMTKKAADVEFISGGAARKVSERFRRPKPPRPPLGDSLRQAPRKAKKRVKSWWRSLHPLDRKVLKGALIGTGVAGATGLGFLAHHLATRKTKKKHAAAPINAGGASLLRGQLSALKKVQVKNAVREVKPKLPKVKAIPIAGI